MPILRRLKPYLGPHATRFVQAGLVMACVAILNGAVVGIVKPMIDDVFIRRDSKMLLVVVGLIPLIFLLKFVFTYIQNYLVSYLAQRVTQKLREDLFCHLHELSMDFFWRSKSGELISRLTNDMARLQDGLQNIPLFAVRDVLTILGLIAVMFYINARFAMTAIIAIPTAGIVLGILGKKLRRTSRKSQEIMGEISHRFQESLQGMLVVKAFNYEESAIAKFRKENDSFFDQTMSYFRATALSSPIMEFLGSLIMAAVVYQAGRAIIAGHMTPGVFFSFLTAFFSAYAPLKNIAQMNAVLQLSLSSAERIFSILDEKPTVRENPSALSLQKVSQGIEFQKVSFRYPGRDEWALKNVALSLPRGQVTAVAGASGSGKTTLIHLLLRLFDPTEGRIVLDGQDLGAYSTSSLRGQIGLVTQDTILFNDTVFENVAVGRPGASREDVQKALEAANAWGFVEKLPQGLDTSLGERGLQLSGGQRQRLAIARAVLKDPSILILDEATSQLDNESERSVQKALENLFPGRTVLIVAHRLSTIQNTDRIVVLNRGEIAETGRHAELLAKGGIYTTLYRFQEIEPLTKA